MIYRFDDCLLDSDRRELRRGGIACQIEPQVFDLLHLLIVNRERVLSREEIFKVVWRERIVSESVLGNRINAARAAIGDNGARQRLIRTLRRRGFRFVGAVSEEAERPANTMLTDPGVVRPGKLSLAVLPIASAPGDDELTWVCKGIADELTITLARSRSFDLIAHNYLCGEFDNLGQIARELNVSYLLMCRLRKAVGQIRIAVRLIHTGTGSHIWAQSYHQEYCAGFADEDRIAAQIAAAVEPCIFAVETKRQREKPFHALDADDCVLMALSVTRRRTRQNYALAEKLLARAVELDPNCVRAHSVAAYNYGVQISFGWKSRHNTLPIALEAARTAILIEEHDPWGHFALGSVLAQGRSPEEAIEHHRKALAINSYLPHAHYCLATALSNAGQAENALTAVENGDRLGAPEIFPGHGTSVRASIYFQMEKHRDGIAAARHSVSQSPGHIASQRRLVVSSALAREIDEARAALKTFLALVPNASLSLIADSLAYMRDNDVTRTLDAFHLMGVK